MDGKKEYFERNALIDDLIHNRSFYPAIVKNAIKNAPAADVAPVVHGEWLDCECHNDIVQCSVCGDIYNRSFVRGHKYCNCGAKMDEEETHG